MLRVVALAVALSLCACITGPDGPQGPVGPQGEQGEPGAPGITPVISYYCDGDAYFGTTFFPVVVQRHEFSDGTVLMQCYVVGTAFTPSSTELYQKGQLGAQNGACFVGADIDTASGGEWQFRLPSGSAYGVATYVDRTSTWNGRQFSFPCQTFP